VSEEMEKIIESKREMRKRLAALPIIEKLRMLDQLRERELAIRGQSGDAPTKSAEDDTPEQGNG
jgi:hypothetical protein